ncbi:MAG: aldo/keto reductase [Candidatus Brocadiaceae bacterium]|jgi:hypothetical protein
MRKTVLGRSELEVSAVGFGGIPIQRLPERDAVRVVRRALDLGVTFIDTACAYTDSQRKIGRAIEGRREGVVLATKTLATSKEDALEDIGRSRRELGVETIDLYQLHGVSSPDKWERMSAPGGALEALLQARDRGHVGHVGFSSHNLEVALELIRESVFETVQFPFNMVTCEPGEQLIPEALERDLGFIAMKPLCGGQYSNANLAFKFLNGYPDIMPIPGIEREQEIEEIVSLVESGRTLEGEERRRAEQAAAELGKLFCRRCGYCQPCPQGVPVTRAMIFEGLVKRLPRERVAEQIAPDMVEAIDRCVGCGECEEKCPYDLPIIDTLERVRQMARALARD